jgi:hypothetical protein
MKVGLIKKLMVRDSFGIDSLLARSLMDRAVNEPSLNLGQLSSIDSFGSLNY